MLRWLGLVFLLLMTLPIAPGHAVEDNAFVLTGPADIGRISRHIEYITDPDWQLTIADFAASSPVSMKPLPGPVPDFGYTPARIWLKLSLVNGTGQAEDWRCFVHANFWPTFQAWQIHDDGTVEALVDLPPDSPFDARAVAHPQIVAPFRLAPGAHATLVMAYSSQGSSRTSLSIETPDSFAALSQATAAKNYVFYGLILGLIVMASIAVVVVRQWLFVIFGAYILSLFLYVAHTDGTAFQYLWPDHPGFNGMASVILGTGVIVFGAMFAIVFLQTRRYHPIMHVVLLAMIGSVLTLDIVLWIVDPQLLKKLLVMMISVGGLVFVTTAIIAAFKRFQEVQFYLYAWLAYLIPTSLFTARHILGFELEAVSLYDTVRAGMIFDAYLMGFATINQLLQSRERAMAESLALAQRNVSLGERLAVLDSRYEQLDRQSRQREESVKDTVHDLRQPMHALRLSLRQMLSPQANSAADAGHVESALGYMERLVAERLADDPRARETGGLPPVAHEPGSDGVTPAHGAAAEPGLHAVLRGIADMFAPEAAAKGLDLRLVLAAPDAAVAAYPLMRVVANLVSNAIKYTRQGRVVIALRRHGLGHRVEVHDTGPGLSGAAFEQALLRSQRLDRDCSEAEGSGLGLSVVKEIATVHDWPVSSCAGRRTGATIRVGIAVGESSSADRWGGASPRP